MKNIITIALFVLISCGGREHATVAQTPVAAVAAEPVSVADPCALVTPPDMAVMFGELKEGPSPSTGLRDERQCNYTNMSGSWIKLSLYSGQERWDWEKGITNAQNPRAVGGLGDEAFAIKRGTDSVVYVRKGQSILELSCSCSSENAEAIARVATTRL